MGQNGRDDYIQKFSVNAMKENYYEIIEKYKKILQLERKIKCKKNLLEVDIS